MTARGWWAAASWALVAAALGGCGGTAAEPTAVARPAGTTLPDAASPTPRSDGFDEAMDEAAAGVTDPALAALLRRHWAWTLEDDPVFATRLGVRRFDDRLRAYGPAARLDRQRRRRAFRAEAQAIDPARLNETDRLSHTLLLEELESAITSEICRFDLWTVNARSNPVTRYNRLHEDHPIRDARDEVSLLARYRAVAAAVDREGDDLRRGAAEGLRSPAESIRRVLAMFDEQLARPPDTWAMSQPVAKMSRPERSKALATVIEDDIRRALERYRVILRDEVLPLARPDEASGLAALPLGPACYRARIRHFVTRSPSPDEVHRIGLEEIARTDAELAALGAEALGSETLEGTLEALRTDPALYFDTADEVEAAARQTLEVAKARMPQFFGVLPRASCIVKRIPAYEAPFTTIAYYRPPHADGSKPGAYFVNTHAPQTRPRYQARVLAVHEAIPGHHLQIAIAAELPELPAFRKHGGFTAFVEGWGLYTERLGAEMGLYPTALDRIGVVSFDAWRAGRLVVDTGIHHRGWSRQRARAFLEAHTALSPSNIDNEVDRYINWPGQALAYKLGQLEILQLRREAKEALGPRFSLPSFHDAVLTGGAMSLPALRRRVVAWYQASNDPGPRPGPEGTAP
ncbi:MAG: DUF885 domain-containing protein [Myxococcota bacterium]